MILDRTIKPHRLLADDGKKLYDKTVILQEGEERYYFKIAYLPNFMTLEICQERYGEVDEVGEVPTDDNNVQCYKHNVS